MYCLWKNVTYEEKLSELELFYASEFYDIQ